LKLKKYFTQRRGDAKKEEEEEDIGQEIR